MIIKPELQNDFPMIKGITAVYFLGFVLLMISVMVAFLLKAVLFSWFYIKEIKRQNRLVGFAWVFKSMAIAINLLKPGEIVN